MLISGAIRMWEDRSTFYLAYSRTVEVKVDWTEIPVIFEDQEFTKSANSERMHRVKTSNTGFI